MNRFSSTFHVVYENDFRDRLQDDVHVAVSSRIGDRIGNASQGEYRIRGRISFLA
jgi:hypothetical protein